MQATMTARRYFSNRVLVSGLTVCILAGSAIVAGASQMDSHLSIGSSSTVEMAAPAFQRPADRPRVMAGASSIIAPAHSTFHRPSDRGPLISSYRQHEQHMHMTINRPTDRP